MENNFTQEKLAKPTRINRKKLLVSGGLVLLIIFGYYAINFGLAYRKITILNSPPSDFQGTIITLGDFRDVIDEQDLPLPKKEADRFDVLILGIRGVNDPNGGLLTDSIILFSLDKNTGETAMVSIPRDLYLNLTDRFQGKINEVYEQGVIAGRAFSFTKDTFSRVTGVYIDNVSVFDFSAFGNIIEAVDGVTVTLDVPFEEKIQWGEPFFLPAGENNLNTEQALYYSRSRFSSNDFDRARRQQQIILAIKEKALKLGFLSNPKKVTELALALGDGLKTDLGIFDIPEIISLGQSLNSQNKPPKQLVLTTQNVLYQTTETGAYILLPKLNDYKEISTAIKNII
ncbi:MAG: hypothetical protein COV31_01365 [Candidatus Yanofskybacteria bacterium CG10_big_fil_rev_8_21_14_0_10_46_23]|uniref:Cell envelope-related transcriptional attenuator domain-containing protein n=1 Tax=Candidatus Yanofskybacteria bacterium CG10_big_fil_rev_8_21_14_0_10_46_23 TaxID=1975098 RepID=A0A2H0R4Q4_9BACT|nr:MAG: hypothetical protein COV31_01365 [Candidatus Yanofskybacteria bacterium CG10_big_fil_rev_8_21_14_0_10_46_23]